MKKFKVIICSLLILVLAICFASFASAEKGTQQAKSFTEIEFERFTIGESYKTIENNNILYDTAYSFTVDHNGNIYLVCVTNGKDRKLMAYSPGGEYLYSILLPLAEYQLSTDEKENNIYVASSLVKTILKFDDNGTLLDIIHDSDSESKFYQTPIFPKVSPFGEFRKEQTSKTVTIFLRANGEETVYFQKEWQHTFFDILGSCVFAIFFIVLSLLLLDGMIYKIRTKGKMTDAFFFRCIKKLFSKFEVTKK